MRVCCWAASIAALLTKCISPPLHAVPHGWAVYHMYIQWAIRHVLQTIEYKLLASLNALNVVQSLIIFSGLAAGLTVCAKASTC